MTFVLFIPGYAIVWAVFPRKKQLDTIERVVLGFAFSIATIPLIIFYSNRLLKIPVNFVSVFLIILLISSVAVFVWYKRKS